MRFCRSLLAVVFLALPCFAFGQSTNASLTGIVDDPSKAILSEVSITAINTQTGVRSQTFTNSSGEYVLPALPPGSYRIEVDKQGFKGIIEAGLTLHVQDVVQMNFHMTVGSASESVTVNAGGLQMNTTDASVSTVVDRQFVENMPLNGRSFQALILLSPGVLTTSPQNGTSPGQSGEFSINGQRTDANSYSIDGLSANNGAPATTSGPGNAGSIASFSALGTTQSLISVDALQEFRIITSTYSAEYGRQPGGQVELSTRSGTDEFHGTAFDYFRNAALDANNWFNDHNNPIIAKPAERQNDFGGVLGGPLSIPKLYSGKNRAFFFFSYEGLRLTQPQPATVLYVPSNGTNNTATYSNPQYENLRAYAPAALQPALNAFPQPNCTIFENPQCIDHGDGLSPYILSTSLPSRLDAISVRADYQVTPRIRIFLRYGDTTSSAVQSVSTYKTSLSYRTQYAAFGTDTTISSSKVNEFRLGYSPTHGTNTQSQSLLGGATPIDLLSSQAGIGLSQVAMFFPAGEPEAITARAHYGAPQHQWNVVDTLTWLSGEHHFRLGMDYRRTTSYQNTPGLTISPSTFYGYASAKSVLNNLLTSSDDAMVEINSEQAPEFTNVSAFFQDEWHVRPQVNLSFGARWELNPPPGVVAGTQPRTIAGNFSDPSSLTLAPMGTPLYKTTYYNFAPRLGVAIILHNEPQHQTILRSGVGVYFDTGQNFRELFGDSGPGVSLTTTYVSTATSPVSFPFTPAQIDLNLSSTLTPPYPTMFVVSPHLQLPYTFQWNTTLEQAFGAAQSVTIGYIGSNGRRLLSDLGYTLTSVNPQFTTVTRYANGLSSSYNSLQLQYKRAISHGLQVLGGYTWSHALDYESVDSTVVPYQRGNSDNDVRSNFTVALSYDLPTAYAERWSRSLFGGWGSDIRFTARTAFPVELAGPELVDPSGNKYYSTLNYNGSNPYVYKAGIPGGRQLSPAAFSVPLTGQTGTSPRNFLRGFGEHEADMAIRRQVPLYEHLHLQFRAEAFNLLNSLNFGKLNVTCGTSKAGAVCTNTLIGQATGTLATALGGGLTQLYQQGGPRSLQLTLKLIF